MQIDASIIIICISNCPYSYVVFLLSTLTWNVRPLPVSWQLLRWIRLTEPPLFQETRTQATFPSESTQQCEHCFSHAKFCRSRTGKGHSWDSSSLPFNVWGLSQKDLCSWNKAYLEGGDPFIRCFFTHFSGKLRCIGSTRTDEQNIYLSFSIRLELLTAWRLGSERECHGESQEDQVGVAQHLLTWTQRSPPSL